MPVRHASVPLAGDQTGARILVVDDEPSICLVLRKCLALDGLRVETATNPHQALARLMREPFDLLVADISMPEMNGLELAEQARAHQTLLGVIIMTAYGSAENLTRALRVGIADFIAKPFNIEDMRLAVRRALERQRLQRENLRLHMLTQILEYSQRLNSTLDLETLYRTIAEIVAGESGARGVELWLANEAQALRLVYRQGALAEHAAAAAHVAEQCYCRGELQHTTLDMPRGHVVVGMPLRIQDERLGALVSVHDTSPPRSYHEVLSLIANQAAQAIHNAHQYHTLRELDRLKSEFIGIASHELRTPLALVLGYSSLLRHRLQGQERELIQQVIDGARRMNDIIDDLINLRAAEVGQLPLALESVDLWEVLRLAVEELQALAAARQITLHLQVPAQPLLMEVDRVKLALVVGHLIDNATKFNEPGGVVRVTAAQVEREGQAWALIEVQDSGWGIAEHDLAHIFDRFYQAAPSATRPRNGLGIGLSLSRTFVELHGGRIEVESRSGQGSTFRIWLPVRTPASGN